MNIKRSVPADTGLAQVHPNTVSVGHIITQISAAAVFGISRSSSIAQYLSRNVKEKANEGMCLSHPEITGGSVVYKIWVCGD